MKSHDYEAVVYDSSIYCNECCPVNIDSEDVQPIFADSEWDYYPTCEQCDTTHEYISLTSEGLEKLNEGKIHCVLDGNRGVYIPQHFVEGCDPKSWGVKTEDITILSQGPDHEDYWDTWENVISYAQFKDKEANIWSLCQDGDLFMVREDYDHEH